MGNDVLRMRGKGIQDPRGRSRGDQLVSVRWGRGLITTRYRSYHPSSVVYGNLALGTIIELTECSAERGWHQQQYSCFVSGSCCTGLCNRSRRGLLHSVIH